MRHGQIIEENHPKNLLMKYNETVNYKTDN